MSGSSWFAALGLISAGVVSVFQGLTTGPESSIDIGTLWIVIGLLAAQIGMLKHDVEIVSGELLKDRRQVH